MSKTMMLEDWITELNVNRLSQPYSTLAILKGTGTFGMCDYTLILVCHNHLKLLKLKQKGFQAFTSSESFLEAFSRNPSCNKRLFGMPPTLPPNMITNEKHPGHWNLHLHMLVVAFCPDTAYVFFPGIRTVVRS